MLAIKKTYLFHLGQLHILRVDTKDLQSTCGVRNADVNLAIEPTEPTESRVNGVWSIGGRHDHNVRTRLKPIHESEELGHDAALDFTVGLGDGGKLST